jgi:phosphate transport system permease protein
MSAVVTPEQVRSSVDLALRGNRRDLSGRLFELGLLLSLIASLGVLIALLWITIDNAMPVLSERPGDFVSSNWSQIPSRVGVRQGIVGSLILIGFVLVVAIPLGCAAAIYLQEYARDTRLNRLLITNIRNLAGVPSIVFGILGLIILVQTMRAVTGPGDGKPGLTYISGGLTISVLVMPIVILVAMEALRAVPQSIREAAYGVGATRWEVVRSHVLPYAFAGILTGVILSLARAFGETAPLLLVGASTSYFSSASGRGFLEILQGSYTALPTQIFSFARQAGADWKPITSAAIVVLLVVIIVVNAVAIILRNRYERKW